MKYGIKDNMINSIVATFKSFPEIDKAVVYGSRAMGNYKIASDIDLVLIGKNLNLTILNKIDLALEDLYLPYKLDLTLYNYLENEDLIDHIKRVGVVLYQKDKPN